MSQEKTYKVLTTPGLSIHTVSECKDCINLSDGDTCRIWAFPGEKWNSEDGCNSFHSFSAESGESNEIN